VKPFVVMVENGTKQPPELMDVLGASGMEVLRCAYMRDLEKLCQEGHFGVLILDLDNSLFTNRVLREIARKCPCLKIIGISGRFFHPELEEAMRSYLYACISKPVDMEELIYLVKSIFRNLTQT
jgi:DNA-binding NtrC family response regulator